MFQRTTVINKILKLNKFVKGVQGGTSAFQPLTEMQGANKVGKTFGIIPILINIAALNPLTEISIVAESIPHLKRGAMKDFKKIMQETKRWVDNRWNASDFKYTFANGSQIEFFSADSDAKLRGARRDYLYMNECNNMTFHAYTELASRTKQGIYLDWNPTNEFWFHTELQGDADVDFIIVNYEDNEACPESALNFINKAKEKSATSAYWANWYKVYGLGQIGSLQGAVFENWEQCKEIPSNAEFISYGMDWGFTNDPSALVGIWKYNNELYIKELIYQRGLTNDAIATKLRELNIKPTDTIIADSSEPKSIQEVYNYGYNIQGANKGADSIKNSIDVLLRYKMNITEDSTNIIKELRSYKWDTDKDGKTINKPIDYLNHSIDAIRYVALNKLANLNSGRYTIIQKLYLFT